MTVDDRVKCGGTGRGVKARNFRRYYLAGTVYYVSGGWRNVATTDVDACTVYTQLSVE